MNQSNLDMTAIESATGMACIIKAAPLQKGNDKFWLWAYQDEYKTDPDCLHLVSEHDFKQQFSINLLPA